MKLRLLLGTTLVMLSFPLLTSAQLSMELEEACFMDIELTDYIVEIIDQGNSSINVVDSEEASQIEAVLNEGENSSLGLSDKLNAVLTACAEGRILQNKNARILNTPTN